MVKFYSSLDDTFGALADPTRRAILARLVQGDATIMELAQPFSVSLPAISKHIRILEAAGLLRRTKVGREYHCQLRLRPLRDAETWISEHRQFWEKNLESLARYIEKK